MVLVSSSWAECAVWDPSYSSGMAFVILTEWLGFSDTAFHSGWLELQGIPRSGVHSAFSVHLIVPSNYSFQTSKRFTLVCAAYYLAKYGLIFVCRCLRLLVSAAWPLCSDVSFSKFWLPQQPGICSLLSASALWALTLAWSLKCFQVECDGGEFVCLPFLKDSKPVLSVVQKSRLGWFLFFP